MQLKSVFIAPLAALLLGVTLSQPVQAASIAGQGSWESTLLGRDINRNAVAATSAAAVYLYDSTLNITWLRDANMSGELSWFAARQWADDLVTGSGDAQFSDWRLPGMTTAQISDCDFAFAGTNCGYNVAAGSSELASLFHISLGNQSRYDEVGDERLDGAGLSNQGSFLNLQAGGYWLADAIDAEAAWRFDTFDGVQDVTFKEIPFFAMAVRGGDVLATPVPEPQSLALVLGGLTALALGGRRRKLVGQ